MRYVGQILGLACPVHLHMNSAMRIPFPSIINGDGQNRRCQLLTLILVFGHGHGVPIILNQDAVGTKS